MSAYRLRGGRVIDPARNLDAVGDVYVRDGVIVSDLSGEYVDIPCEGLVVSPGFVELHSELASPIQDGQAALAGGFTAVVHTPVDTVAALLLQRGAFQSEGPRVVQSGAASVGLQGTHLADMGSLLDAGALVLSHDREWISSSAVLRNMLQYASGFGSTVFLRAGDAALEAGPVREGEVSTLLGMRGTPPQAEAIGVWRLAMLADLTGARIHITHVWSAKGVQALRYAREQGIRITGSTTAFHLTQDPMSIGETYAGHWRTTPPLGDAADRAALVDGLRDGTLVAVAADHRPLAASAQEQPLEFAASGSIMFSVAAALCIETLGVVDGVRVLTQGPASVVGLRATLAPASPANITVINPAGDWRFNAAESLASQRNTPLDGAMLRARVVSVFREGKPHRGAGLDPMGRPGKLHGIGDWIQ